MGIEIWVLVVLVAILAVYLLPFLVGRREVMRMSNAEDRYSSELRVLATGDAVASDEACVSTGHAEIFRRRPEVKAMNRPAVRNVRALRTERELDRARRAHEDARERRRIAAHHRAVVAATLTGIALGVVTLCYLISLPWYSVSVPAALLLVSMTAGRRAARRSAASDRRERQRIAEIEHELMALTGERPSSAKETAARDSVASATYEAGAAGTASTWAEVEAEATRRAERAEAAVRTQRTERVERAERAAAEKPARAAAEKVAGTARVRDDAETWASSSRIARPASVRARRSASSAGVATSAASGTSGTSAASAASAASAGVAASVASADAAGRRGEREIGTDTAVQRAVMAVAWPVTELESAPSPHEGEDAGEAVALDDAAPAAASVGRASGAGAGAAASASATSVRTPARTTSGGAGDEPAPVTPPQGWRPVHVPAPTYTLAPRAPRRNVAELEEESYPSAPVPARPTSVRTLPTEGVEREEIEFHPIDLDAVLEKRRAAGA